jgi:protein-S-isoprenylcysteine O-methyltransferase Ste14
LKLSPRYLKELPDYILGSRPYALVRHPMYAGASVMLIGTALALGSFLALIPAFAMVGGIILMLLEEEKFLVGYFSGYKDYCEKTRFRLIPEIW